MSQRTITECDRCGKPVPVVIEPIYIPIGESRDPVDGRTSRDYERFDLCHSCMRGVFVRQVVKGMSDEEGVKFLAEANTFKSKG